MLGAKQTRGPVGRIALRGGPSRCNANVPSEAYAGKSSQDRRKSQGPNAVPATTEDESEIVTKREAASCCSQGSREVRDRRQ
eukprot:1045106-Pyramimonas_sp.AAC.1